MMYYIGIPFVDRNKIDEDELRNHSSFFKTKEEKVLFAEKIFESCKMRNNCVDLVIYFNAQWNDPLLIEYHNKYYAGIPYFVQKLHSSTTIYTTIVKEDLIIGYRISHHREDWLETIEQSYDADFNLIEYREFLYEKGSDMIIGENIFYASNWLINKERYD